jgi:hypothetical protein
MLRIFTVERREIAAAPVLELLSLPPAELARRIARSETLL